jgi:formate--tetrahydrofolate ligase
MLATKMALKLSDYAITEAGFAADLGAEKFLDIKCRKGNLNPSAVVIVATVKALKLHGGMNPKELKEENLDALAKGIENLDKHIENMKGFGLPVVVAINKFVTDSDAELAFIDAHCNEMEVPVALCDVWANGGAGGEELAKLVINEIDTKENNFKYLYDLDSTIEEKITTIVKNIYGGDGVEFSLKAKKMIKTLVENRFDNLPICMSKTQKSISDNPKLMGRPSGFTVTVNELRLSAGAVFIVAMAGSILDMPGLPKIPSAELIDIDENGVISGLF